MPYANDSIKGRGDEQSGRMSECGSRGGHMVRTVDPATRPITLQPHLLCSCPAAGAHALVSPSPALCLTDNTKGHVCLWLHRSWWILYLAGSENTVLATDCVD